MYSDNNLESESSLPTLIVPIIHSSPPDYNPSSGMNPMANNPTVKPESPTTKDAESSRPSLRRVSSDETERPPSAQQVHNDTDEQVSTSGEDDSEAEDSSPSERIVDFDWNDLHERYHKAINKCQGQETELIEEWETLMTVLL